MWCWDFSIHSSGLVHKNVLVFEVFEGVGNGFQLSQKWWESVLLVFTEKLLSGVNIVKQLKAV